MTGTVVTSRPGGSVAAVIWFLLAVGAVAAAVLSGNVHWAVLAVLPGVLGLTASLSTDPAVEFEITADGLVFHTPERVFVRYTDIQGLTAPTKKSGDSFAMQLYHSAGVIRIPARLDVSSWDLHDYLLSRLPPPGSTEPEGVPSALRPFLADQLRLFGEERVFVFRARPFDPLPSYGRHVAYSLAVAATGGLWIVAGVVLVATLEKKNSGDGGAWVGGGVLLLVLGLLFAFLFSRASVAGRVKGWQNSCLVVSPGGIALVQGPMKGKMRWDELRAVEFPAKPRFGLSTAGGTKHGVGLLVEGAYLVIADYYDHPLSVIYDHLSSYWGGREAN